MRTAGEDLSSDRAGWVVLGVLSVAAVVLLVVLGTRLTFFSDDWFFLLQRPGLSAHRGLDVLLAPHNGNLVALVVVIYKLLTAGFGLTSQLPFRLVLAAVVAAVGILVFVLVRGRMGVVPALIAAGIVLFLGPAWEDQLLFASIDLVGSLATGLAALLALERDTPRRNALAGVLLVCSVAMSNLGIPFLAGAVVALGLRRRAAQLWIPGVPAALFAAWRIGYGRHASSTFSIDNVEHLPRYIAGSIASGLTSLTGLNRGSGAPHYVRGGLLVAILAVLVVVRWRRGSRPASWILVFASTALTFWVIAGLGYSEFLARTPGASRYQLFDAALLILIVAELFGTIQLRRPAWAGVALLAVVVVVSNLNPLSHGYRLLRDQSTAVKTDLGALNIVRGFVNPNLRLGFPLLANLYVAGITAGRYFDVTRTDGPLPSFSVSQMATAPAFQRREADSILVASELGTRASAPPRSVVGCRRYTARPAGGLEIALTPGRTLRLVNLVRPGTAPVAPAPGASPASVLRYLARVGLTLQVRRFAPPGLRHPLTALRPGRWVALTARPDDAGLPWRVSVTGAQRFAVCASGHRA